jgi:hypothetical protein
MRLLKVLLAVGLLLAAGPAIAGKGGPSASGAWGGQGQAIYPDGTIADITLVEAVLVQNGAFISGYASFHVEIDGDQLEPQEGQMSGHINGNKISGVLGGCDPFAPYCAGAAVFEGKLSGNKLTGTVRDLSDGSTSTITLFRMRD